MLRGCQADTRKLHWNPALLLLMLLPHVQHSYQNLARYIEAAHSVARHFGTLTSRLVLYRSTKDIVLVLRGRGWRIEPSRDRPEVGIRPWKACEHPNGRWLCDCCLHGCWSCGYKLSHTYWGSDTVLLESALAVARYSAPFSARSPRLKPQKPSSSRDDD